MQRVGEWLVEPVDSDEPELLVPEGSRHLVVVPPQPYPVVAVVGLSRRCGATTLARALGAELGARQNGAAVVASRERPAVVALGSSAPAVRLAESLASLPHVRPAGRLCLAMCEDPAEFASLTRRVAPAVVEVEPGTAALEAAPAVDRVVLVAAPDLEPALAGAVAETICKVAEPPVVAVNRAPEGGPWLIRGDVLVPESRMGARLALSGREARGWLGKSIGQLADLCVG